MSLLNKATTSSSSSSVDEKKRKKKVKRRVKRRKVRLSSSESDQGNKFRGKKSLANGGTETRKLHVNFNTKFTQMACKYVNGEARFTIVVFPDKFP